MTEQTRRAELAQRLDDAKRAHVVYEKDALQGHYDAQWADWYADYLIAQGWNNQFVQAWDRTELAAALVRADAAHRANAPESSWEDYYAGVFDERR